MPAGKSGSPSTGTPDIPPDETTPAQTAPPGNAAVEVELTAAEGAAFKMKGPATIVINLATSWMSGHHGSPAQNVRGTGFSSTERSRDFTPHELDSNW